MTKPLMLTGAAFAIGGAHIGTRHAPVVIKRRIGTRFKQHRIVWQYPPYLKSYRAAVPILKKSTRQLAHHIRITKSSYFPIIIGGDHSCAIGTWQGISNARQKIGLLWIDAHFDSHTAKTSYTQRTHGMPLAMLLGCDEDKVIANNTAIVDYRHCIIFGARSFEPEEQRLLNELNVRYYTMKEIKTRGFYRCFNEAWRKVSACQYGFGISLDLDAIDPKFAPAVSVKAPRGLAWSLLFQALTIRRHTYKLKAVELAEFNPYLDKQHRTLDIIKQLIRVYSHKRG